MLRKLFGWKKERSEEEIEKLEDEWYDKKSKMMESILGEEHGMVMHAIIPYEVGGSLDLYYYPNEIPGTAVATKELTFACQESASNDKFEKYELVIFTKHDLDLDQIGNKDSPFNQAHHNINVILNAIARYSEHAKLNPLDTCEFPPEIEEIGGKCVIFFDYGSGTEGKEEFGLLGIMEVFRNEMEFAMQNGTGLLIERLKGEGAFPYSDMDRESVV